MAPKPKIGGVQKRPTKAALPKAKEKSQRERFVEAARAVGVDETGRSFDRAIRTLVPPKGPR